DTCFMHTLNRSTHGAYTRKDNFVCLRNQFRMIGHINRGTDMFECFCCRVQISHAIIKKGNTGHYSVPLVEATVFAARGSTSQAIRSARAKALNTLSTW